MLRLLANPPVGFPTVHQQIKNKEIPTGLELPCVKWKPAVITGDRKKEIFDLI